MNVIVYCVCKSEVQRFNRRPSITIICRCLKCGRYLRYNPEKNTVVAIDKPVKKWSSGMTFY